MKASKIEKLIIKYVSKSISANELNELSIWLENPKNEQIFNDYVRINYAIDYNLSQYNVEKTKTVLNKRIKKDNNIFYRINVRSVLKYAAIFVGIIGITYFFVTKNITTDIQDGQLIIAEEDITLELENGKVKILKGEREDKIVNSKGVVVGVQNGNRINYNNNANIDKLVYNELTIPNGKTFQLTLSDGTDVFLNAGTSIKYPVKFIDGLERKIFLQGEAYFDVTKDDIHPFIVNANNMNVRVLGTEFNVSCYPEEISVNTVLVEGAVKLYSSGEEYNEEKASTLIPGHKASWDRSDNLSIEKVDTDIYTGWIEGKLIFKNTPFRIIQKKLERHYNVTIINNNEVLDGNTYTAVFDVETIVQVLQTLNESYRIDYEIIDSKIIIN